MSGETRLDVIKALADETRWGIVAQLMRAPRTAKELRTRLKRAPTLQPHLQILLAAGILEMEREGRTFTYHVPGRNREGNALKLGGCVFRFQRVAGIAPK